MALSLDQFGNVNNKNFFNFIMIKRENRLREVGEDYLEVYKNGKVINEHIILYDYHKFGDEG